MLLLSAIAVFSLLFGFFVNGRIPFEEPISLLVEGSEPWVYQVILVSLGAVVFRYLRAPSRRQGPVASALGYLVLIILILLIFIDYRVQPAHDILTFFLFFVASVFLFNLSTFVPNPYLRFCVSVPFLAVPLVFSNLLTAIALVEFAILSSSLILINLSYYRPSFTPPVDSSLLRDFFRYGSRLRGYLWGCFCVFLSGVCGVYSGMPLAAVFHFVLCWYAGYLSKRFESFFPLEAFLLSGSGIGFVIVLTFFGEVSVHSVLLPFFLMTMSIVLLRTYRRLSEQLRAPSTRS